MQVAHATYTPTRGRARHRDMQKRLYLPCIVRRKNRRGFLFERVVQHFFQRTQPRQFGGDVGVKINVDGLEATWLLGEFKSLNHPLETRERSAPIVGVNVLVLIRRKDLKLITKIHAQTLHLGYRGARLGGHRVAAIHVQHALLLGQRNGIPSRHGIACPQEQGNFFSRRGQTGFDVANGAFNFTL